MAWKKLAFTDEVMLLNGSQAMSGTLMMGDYFITGITQLSPSGTTITVDGILDVNSHKITSVTDPTAAQDAATKAWVEANTATNPMAADLDMADNNIIGVNTLFATGDTDKFNVYGGSDSAESLLEIFGSNHASTPGLMRFNSVNAAKTGNVTSGYFDGVTDTPELHLLHGLDMNKKEIEAMCFENLASAPATPGAAQIYYDTADDHLYVNVV